MQRRRLTHLSRVLLVVALVAIFSLAMTRTTIPQFGTMNDKLNHLIAFFALALLADFSWPATRFNAPKILSLLCYGLAIEIAQYYVGYRHFSLLDIGADGAGLSLYAMTVPLLKTVFPFNVRWE